MNQLAHSIHAPNLLRLMSELRAPWEFGASLAAIPLPPLVARGDGHPVVVFPGLIASDASTLLLRRFIDAIGYEAYAWEQGPNLGSKDGVMDACVQRVEAIATAHGRKVTIIGWSLGGIFAREVAKLLPDLTRGVITLGTPFTGPPDATNATTVYELVTGRRVEETAHEWAKLHEAPAAPTTSIYSRSDGVVAWQCSIQPPASNVENIAVNASHIGLGAHPAVLYAIADRLSQAEGKWVPFKCDGLRNLIYEVS